MDVKTRCCVKDCAVAAVYEVYLHDNVPHYGLFFEVDHRCPYLCQRHAEENEEGAIGVDGRSMRYPFTKPNTQGTTRYKKLATGGFLRSDGFFHPALLRAARKRRDGKARLTHEGDTVT
jgi:hypothetical protein